MEVKIKFNGIQKLRIGTKVNDDITSDEPALTTNISFEVEGKVADLSRLLSLARQQKPLHCVIGCDQAIFDITIGEERRETIESKKLKPLESTESEKVALGV